MHLNYRRRIQIYQLNNSLQFHSEGHVLTAADGVPVQVHVLRLHLCGFSGMHASVDSRAFALSWTPGHAWDPVAATWHC